MSASPDPEHGSGSVRPHPRSMQQGVSMRILISYGFLAPPNILIILCFTGALLSLVWRRAGIIVALISSFSLYVAATPAFSSYLLWYLESKIPESKNLSIAQAIVV